MHIAMNAAILSIMNKMEDIKLAADCSYVRILCNYLHLVTIVLVWVAMAHG